MGTGRTPKLELHEAEGRVAPGTRAAAVDARPVLVDRTGDATKVDVFAGGELLAGHELEGPALIDDDDTTVWVPPGALVTVDPWHTLVMEVRA